MAERPSSIARARSAWGDTPPDWIVALAEACDRASQASVAKRLGISGSVVNQVLGRCYAGRMDTAETRVRGTLMAETVACPVLGDVSSARCLDEQRRPFHPTNHQRVRLWKACRSCANNRSTRDAQQ